jgi:8-oxo-dGTP diphosphatase
VTKPQKHQFSVLVGAATVRPGGEFLLLRRSRRESFLPEVWGIPAGQVLPREDPRAACARELKEETGLRGEVGQLIGYSTFQSCRGEMELSNHQLNFLVLTGDSDVTIDPASHSDSRWISLDDIDSDLVDPFTRKVMMAARRAYKEMAPPGPAALTTGRWGLEDV